jgi:hypothetical protein
LRKGAPWLKTTLVCKEVSRVLGPGLSSSSTTARLNRLDNIAEGGRVAY